MDAPKKTSPDLDAGDKAEKKVSEEILDRLISSIEADTLLKETRAAQMRQDTELLVGKWKVGVRFTYAAVIIHAVMMLAGYMLITDVDQDRWVKVVSISAIVLSFMAIYGIIIRSNLAPPQPQSDDSPNVPVKDILEVAKEISEKAE